MTSIEQWERASQQSLQRARDRRQEPRSVHPWPARGERLKAFGIAVLLIAFGYLALIAAALVAPPT